MPGFDSRDNWDPKLTLLNCVQEWNTVHLVIRFAVSFSALIKYTMMLGTSSALIPRKQIELVWLAPLQSNVALFFLSKKIFRKKEQKNHFELKTNQGQTHRSLILFHACQTLQSLTSKNCI